MTRAEYQEYLQSPWWKRVRAFMLDRANYTCQDCGLRLRGPDATTVLEVHHLFYARLGNEFAEDLVVLCTWCHGGRHEKPRTPYDPMEKYRIRRILGVVVDQMERRSA